jgi:DHA1 family inner membrane transport protein
MRHRSEPGVLFAVFIAATGTGIIMLVVLMMGPLVVDMSETLDVSLALIGQLNTVTALTWFAVGVLAGPLSDIYGRKPLLLLGVGGMVLGTLGTGLAWDYPSALVFRGLTGLAGIGPPIFSAFLSDHVPPHQRGRALGAMGVGAGVAGILGVPLVTVISSVQDWRWAFFAVTLMGVAVWLFLMWALPPSRMKARVSLRSLHVVSRYVPLIRISLIRDLTLVSISSRSLTGLFLTYFASFLITQHGFTTAETALPMALVGAAMMFGGMLAGLLSDTRYRMTMMPVALALTGGLGIVTFVLDLHPLWALVAGLGFVLVSHLPFVGMVAFLSKATGSRMRGTAMSLPSFGSQMGSALGPAVGGVALGLGGYTAVGYACLGLGVAGALVGIFRLREHHQRTTVDHLAEMEASGG